MSSYELLELLEFMPEEGAFQRAVRCGEFSGDEQIQRHIASELSRLRATTHIVNGGEAYSPKVFLTLAEIKELQADAESMEETRESVFQFADRTEKYAKREEEVFDDAE